MSRKVDPFSVLTVLALAALVIAVAVILGRSPIGWMIPSAHGGEMRAEWTAPTQNCDGTPLTDLAGYEILWGQNLTTVGLAPLSYTVTGLKPGNWWFSIAAVNSAGQKSQFVTATKTVAPAEFVTKTTTVYTFVRADGNILVLPTLHTVPLGTQCDASQSVNGKYLLPRSAVTWSGSARLVAVLGDCG